jgi:hypothetical protein
MLLSQVPFLSAGQAATSSENLLATAATSAAASAPGPSTLGSKLGLSMNIPGMIRKKTEQRLYAPSPACVVCRACRACGVRV